jgi:hypothetical protein
VDEHVFEGPDGHVALVAAPVAYRSICTKHDFRVTMCHRTPCDQNIGSILTVSHGVVQHCITR